MTNLQKILLILFLLLIPISYYILQKISNTHSNKQITIPPIEIRVSKKDALEIEPDNPSSILSNLQAAVSSSQKNTSLSEEESAKEILANLKNNIYVEKEKVVTIIKKEKIITKEIVTKKIISPKKVIIEQPKPKKVVKEKIIKKKTLIVEKKKVVPKKVLIKKVVLKNPKPIIPKVEILKEEATPIFIQTRHSSRFTREEEVSKYKQQYGNALEVVGVSKNFEIDEPVHKKPDSYYFKDHSPELNKDVHHNTFVKTLGTVDVSNTFEASNVQKILSSNKQEKQELVENGLIDFKHSTIETEELKNLNFVRAIEVVEVSKKFEAIRSKEFID